jgi:beta-glucosidase
LSRRALAGELICVAGAAAEQARQKGAALAALGPTTVRPVPRLEEWWQKRCEELDRRAADERADIVFLGDSITQGWEGEGKQVWAERFGPAQAINLGIGGDRTQHVLWRLKNGHLGGLKGDKRVRRPTPLNAPPPGSPSAFVEETHRAPRLVVLMIGTNNSNGSDNTAEEIAAGIVAIVDVLRAELPDTKVLILGIFPRGAKPNPQRDKNAAASALAAKRADGQMVHYLDIGEKFLTADGTLTTEIMPDLLHLSPKGYAVWADAVAPKMVELLK